jgi:hypothetical protein
MIKWLKIAIPLFTVLVLSVASQAQDVSREQIKGLDEQVQEIKSDILGIAAQLSRLEERLLYPSDTQVAVFVSLAPGETFRLDSVELKIGGKPVTHHLYTYKELEALQKGGVQRIYVGNITTGGHDLEVTFIGKAGGTDLRRTESFTFSKDVGPKIVELALASRTITLKDW